MGTLVLVVDQVDPELRERLAAATRFALGPAFRVTTWDGSITLDARPAGKAEVVQLAGETLAQMVAELQAAKLAAGGGA